MRSVPRGSPARPRSKRSKRNRRGMLPSRPRTEPGCCAWATSPGPKGSTFDLRDLNRVACHLFGVDATSFICYVVCTKRCADCCLNASTLAPKGHCWTTPGGVGARNWRGTAAKQRAVCVWPCRGKSPILPPGGTTITGALPGSWFLEMDFGEAAGEISEGRVYFQGARNAVGNERHLVNR
jgi:hypothetical protein